MKKYLLMLALLVSFSAEAEFNTANGAQGTAMDCLKSARKMLVIGGCLTGQEGEAALKEEQGLYTALGCPAYEPSQQYSLQSLGVLAKAKQDYQADKAKVCSEIGVTESPDQPESMQSVLDAANARLNKAWQGFTPERRKDLLPSQRQWLKDREETCAGAHPNAVPGSDEEDSKLACMASITDDRTEQFMTGHGLDEPIE